MDSCVAQSEKNPAFIKQKAGLLLLSLLGSKLMLSFLSHRLLLTPSIYYLAFQDQLSIEQIDKLIQISAKYEYLGYLLIAVVSSIKYVIITLIIQAGILLWGLKAAFNALFKLVIIAEFIFLVPILIKLVWFYFFKSAYTLEDIQTFTPLSLLSVLSGSKIADMWFYPLQLINLFEVLYWLFLAWGLGKIIQIDFDKGLKIILSTYIPLLFIWVIFVMFLTVTLNPS